MSNVFDDDNLIGGRRLWRTPLLKNNNREAQMDYVKEYVDKDSSFWRQILWSDEIEIELLGEAHNRKNTVSTVKHGMQWIPDVVGLFCFI